MKEMAVIPLLQHPQELELGRGEVILLVHSTRIDNNRLGLDIYNHSHLASLMPWMMCLATWYVSIPCTEVKLPFISSMKELETPNS